MRGSTGPCGTAAVAGGRGLVARILIAVTHLLGSGDLVRAAHLARALARAGHEVVLASGGMELRPMAGEPFAFLQLPPVRIEGVDFGRLLDEQVRMERRRGVGAHPEADLAHRYFCPNT